MNLLHLAAAALLGYLLGSIPFGYLVGRLWGVDVREHGSGRTGGTNVWRAVGKVFPALLAVAGDALKGVAAVLLARSLLQPAEAAAALAGAGAVYGHVWPLFLGLRGGAGGATALMGWVALNPLVGVVNLAVSVGVLLISRYASLGTLTVGVAGLLVSLVLRLARPQLVDPWHVLYAALVTAAIVITLQPNLRRLRQGAERRITLW